MPRITHRQPVQPPPKSPAKPLGLNTELSQVKAQISESRSNIESLEKQFRENVAFRRAQFQPYTIFSAEIPATSLADEQDYAREMIARAKDELLRQDGQKKKMEEIKANHKLDTEEQLKSRIAEASSRFRKKEQLLEAGPKFVHHFSCTSGKVLHVHALTETLYAVFASNNYIEFWDMPKSSPATPTLRDISYLPFDPITTISPLLIEDITPRPPTPSTSSESTTPSTSLPQSRQHSFLEPERSRTNSLWDAPMARRNRVIGNVPEDEVVETVEEEEEGEEKMMSSQAEIQVGDEEEEEEEPGTPSPVVMMRHMFFLGCSSGVGVVYAIETTWEREADALTYTHAPLKSRHLSMCPITLSTFSPFDSTITCLVSHTGADQLLAAFTLDLDDEWQCKGDVLKYTAKDKQLKVIAQTRLDGVKEVEARAPGVGSVTDAPIVTSLYADKRHKHLLVSMRSGAILRLNCETIVVGGARHSVTKDDFAGGHRPSITRRGSVSEQPVAPAPVVRKDLFVAWCLDIHPLPPPPLSRSNAPTQPQPRNVPSFRSSEIQAKNLMTFSFNGRPHLLISCTDGALRLYPMDTGLATAVPVVFNYRDQETVSGETGSTGTGTDSPRMLVWVDVLECAGKKKDKEPKKSFLVAYTADGIFLIYIPNVPTPLLETRLLSSRYGLLPRTATPSGGQQNREPLARKCMMLNNGMCVVMAECEWGLVDLEDVRGWDVGIEAEVVEK